LYHWSTQNHNLEVEFTDAWFEKEWSINSIEIQIQEKNPIGTIGWSQGGVTGEIVKFAKK
jgi:hypothetical protein